MRARAVLVLLALLLVACGKPRRERLTEEFARAASVADPTARMEALASMLWTTGAYRHRIRIERQGHEMAVVAERIDPTTFVEQERFRDVELRAQAVRIWRLYRGVGPEHPLERVRVRIELKVHMAVGDSYEGMRPWNFLYFYGDREAMEAVEGFATRDPWDVDRTDHFDAEGEAFLAQLVETLSIELDGSDELMIHR